MIHPPKSARILTAILIALTTLITLANVNIKVAEAQSDTEILSHLEDRGYYIGPGAEGDPNEFAKLANRTTRTRWYYVSVDGPNVDGLAKRLYDQLSKPGNVLVYATSGDYETLELAASEDKALTDRAMTPFDGNWSTPSEVMGLVVDEYETLQTQKNTGTTTPANTPTGSSSGGFNIFWLVIPALLGLFTMMYFQQRAAKKRRAASIQETATKMRVEIVKELAHLANDVLVLNSAIDMSDNEKAIAYYREASAAYIEISDELPDETELEQDLERSDLEELSELGAEISTARWQMDAAEALLENKPVPPKPEVTTPEPEPQPQPRPPIPEQRIPQRRQQPRVQYNTSGRRNGAGLIDILIAGASMLNQRGYQQRRPRRNRPNVRRSNTGGFILGAPRPRRGNGPGVFGSGTTSQRTRSTSSSASRTRRRPNSSTTRRRAR